MDFDVVTWGVAGIGVLAALACAGQALRLHDSIWHSQRHWAPHFGVASILILAGSLGVAFLIHRF
jgi:hypothetical protein